MNFQCTICASPKEVSADKVDNFMVPLVRELHKLWEAGLQIDTRGERIMVQVMLIHFIHDYPSKLTLYPFRSNLFCAIFMKLDLS